MIELNWRDATKELPILINDCNFQCLIVVQCIKNNKLCEEVTTAFFEYKNGVFKWLYVQDCYIVIKWMPLSELVLFI